MAATSALLVLLLLSMVPLRGHSLTYLLGAPVIAALTSIVLLVERPLLARTRRAGSPVLAAVGRV